MAESFGLSGDPSSIRASGREWQAFADAASGASSSVKSLDTAQFQGDEAETYQDQIDSDLPSHLDTASQAWGIVARALTAYAGELEDYQATMAALATRAGNQQHSVADQQHQLSSAKSADTAHATAVAQARADLKPGETLPADTYHSTASSAQRSAESAERALQSTYDAASTTRSDHADAVRRCRREIERAKDLRFAKPPGFWGRLKDSVGGWIADHADVLMQISGVLKTISGIAALVALIPIPGVQELAAVVALTAGGAALLIDSGVKLATGKGSWVQIGIEALSLIPGAKAAMFAGAVSTANTAYEVHEGKASWGDLAISAAGVIPGERAAQAVDLARTAYTGYQVGEGKASYTEFAMAAAGTAMRGMKATGDLDAMTNRMSYEAGAFTEGMKNALNTGGGGGAGSRFSSGYDNYAHEIVIDSTKYPESADHIVDAQRGTIWSGVEKDAGPYQPEVLTIDRQGADSRRAAAMRGIPAQPGMDRDEYPPAMFAEGGEGASVKYISPGDNRGAGASMGNQINTAGLPDGARVRIVVR